MNVEIDIFAIKNFRVRWIGGAVSAVAAEHRAPSLGSGRRLESQCAIVLRPAYDRAGFDVPGRAVELGYAIGVIKLIPSLDPRHVRVVADVIDIARLVNASVVSEEDGLVFEPVIGGMRDDNMVIG